MTTIAKPLCGEIRDTGTVNIAESGKSAITANKIVATIHSTATPSLFLHAADAIRGDLGKTQSEAPVAAGSKSGTIPGIIGPTLQRKEPQLVALGGCYRQPSIKKI